MISFIWPVVLLFLSVKRIFNGDPQRAARAIGGESRRERAERRERELDQLERDNRRRERELGIES